MDTSQLLALGGIVILIVGVPTISYLLGRRVGYHVGYQRAQDRFSAIARSVARRQAVDRRDSDRGF